jgi:hypothetical protein
MSNRKKGLIICSNPNCNKEFLKDQSEINRNLKVGRKNYCSLECSGKTNNKHLRKYVEENTKYLIADNQRDNFTGLREHLRRVKKRDKNHDITLEDLLEQWEKQKGVCIYSGVELNHPMDGGDNLNKASLDRIDSNKGYVKGNIHFISIACNYAKNNMTHEEMLTFCNIISNFHKNCFLV